MEIMFFFVSNMRFSLGWGDGWFVKGKKKKTGDSSSFFLLLFTYSFLKQNKNVKLWVF